MTEDKHLLWPLWSNNTLNIYAEEHMDVPVSNLRTHTQTNQFFIRK